ncbi:MAG: MFS transporter [Planctomycetaceae bacterium]|jgi:MFS family permease|nr:MFS transporter [Planctomycetaceae bacterium]
MHARATSSHDHDLTGATPNAQRLLWAGFMAILAAGVGFAIRGGILGQWAEQYGFTQTELGAITGGGLTGFGIIILLSSLIADRIGFGTLMFAAFVMHLISAALTLATGAAFAAGGKPLAFQCLFWGMFLFAIGNGIAEAVVNPLVATLFPKNKTHYLNILHAGWPGGLILGGLASYFMAGNAATKPVSWQIQISLFLVPVVFYGLMMLGQRFPKSEASSSGVSFRDMLGELGLAGAAVICCLLALFFKSDLGLSPLVSAGIAAALLAAFGAATGFRFGHLLLAFLLLVHAMVGYVELGTDSWISKITGAIMASPANGLLLFVYTSSLMFILRFFAGPIVEKISPLGLLAASAIFGAIGLTLLGNAEGAVMCVVAATVYGIGKTFLWPTMLAVVSEQFPKGGAITIGAAGGVGMLAAGLLGGPGIGFLQDKNASENLRSADAAVFERYRAPKENEFLWLKAVGLDGAKVGVLEDGGKEAERALALLEKEQAKPETVAAQRELVAWWTDTAAPTRAADQPLVEAAGLFGGRQALKLTALVPATMFVCYALLLAWFKARGGYQARGLGH